MHLEKEKKRLEENMEKERNNYLTRIEEEKNSIQKYYQSIIKVNQIIYI